MPKKLSVPTIRVTAQQQQDVFAQAADPLVSLETVELEGAKLSELAEIIKMAHSSFEAHLGSALQSALIAGRALLAAKEQFVYNRQLGGFRGWITELEISKSSAYRYMDLANHSQIVSQAGTLSEAIALLSQYRAEQRALNPSESSLNLKKRRMTVTLSIERDKQLEQIAKAKGIEISTLINEVIDQWLAATTKF
ncbi:MAG: hypothetical protein VKJ02_04795 [Snowella sp.]|nr:hypothetical protein [Snowella sp.]